VSRGGEFHGQQASSPLMPSYEYVALSAGRGLWVCLSSTGRVGLWHGGRSGHGVWFGLAEPECQQLPHVPAPAWGQHSHRPAHGSADGVPERRVRRCQPRNAEGQAGVRVAAPEGRVRPVRRWWPLRGSVPGLPQLHGLPRRDHPDHQADSAADFRAVAWHRSLPERPEPKQPEGRGRAKGVPVQAPDVRVRRRLTISASFLVTLASGSGAGPVCSTGPGPAPAWTARPFSNPPCGPRFTQAAGLCAGRDSISSGESQQRARFRLTGLVRAY
jgi:hypothetical protein